MEGKYDQDSRKTIRSGGKRDYDSDFILNRLLVRLWDITAIWMSINLFCESEISSLSAAQFLRLCSESANLGMERKQAEGRCQAGEGCCFGHYSCL